MDINEYVVSGTPLQCTLGTEDSTLNVVVPKALTINDKYVATQTDCLPFVNIGSFGMCMASPDRPRECNPGGCWVNVRNELIVGGVPALTRKSKIICTTGCGEITIVDNEESKTIKIYTDISDETRSGIKDWIHKNEELQIENNDLYENIEDYLKSEGYITQKRPDKCKDVCDKTTKNHCGDSKLEVKAMPVSDFMKTAELADNEKLKMMYSRISDNIRKNYIRLDYGKNPLYKSGGGIYGGGDCVSILSHREGYGYTIIEVGDRGSWICAIRHESKGTEDIAFYDGEFEDVYEELMKHF